MELLYMYIKKFDDFIYDQKITFTNNYDITLEDGNLKLKKIYTPLSNLYSSNIRNISLMIGKNGTGKTTILDILGMNRADRLKASFSRKQEIFDEYFILYHLYEDNNGQDIYGIEYIGDSIFGEVITNYEIGSYKDYNNSKVSIGIQFIYNGEKFIDTNKHFFTEFCTKYDKLADYINVIYSNNDGRYSDRIQYDYRAIQEKDDDYLAKRIYYGKSDEALKYKTIHELKINNAIDFFNESAILKIEDNIDYESVHVNTDKDIYKKVITKLEDNLLVHVRKMKFLEKKKTNEEDKKEITYEDKKTRYIYDLFSRYIIDQFINGVCVIIEDNSKNLIKRSLSDDRPENDSILLDLSDDAQISFINGLGIQNSTYSVLGRPTDLEIEAQNLNNVIKYFNPKNKSKDLKECYESLKGISRYISSRIEAQYNLQESNVYEKAMEEFIEILMKLQPEYFHTTNILIPLIKDKKGINASLDKDVYTLLELRRKYRLNEDDYHNGLNHHFKISFCKISEGENNLIDILSKVSYSGERAHSNGLILLLLDEPDRGLHPEWSRKFFYVLVETLSKLKFNVQVIMTTHSPYMLSDVFPQNAFRFTREDRDEGNLKIERLSELSERNNCFGANIYDLMKSNFFMKNSIGEFATNHVKSLLNEISNVDENTSEAAKEKIEFYIENIGEPILKANIERSYRRRLIEISSYVHTNKNYEGLLNIISNPEEKEQVKKFLEKNGGLINDKDKY